MFLRRPSQYCLIHYVAGYSFLQWIKQYRLGRFRFCRQMLRRPRQYCLIHYIATRYSSLKWIKQLSAWSFYNWNPKNYTCGDIVFKTTKLILLDSLYSWIFFFKVNQAKLAWSFYYWNYTFGDYMFILYVKILYVG